jgi:cholest-4-en-3-one 26-monooxygenase
MLAAERAAASDAAPPREPAARRRQPGGHVTIHDIDVYDPDRYADGPPHEDFATLRARSPVHRHPDPAVPAGFWAITRHEDVRFVSRNPEIFSSAERSCLLDEFPPEMTERQRSMMLNMDPPEHSRLRGLVNRGFTPRMTKLLEPGITEACGRIVDDALAQGEGDFVKLCAAELPLVVIADILGAPQEDRHKLYAWSNILIAGQDPELRRTPEEGMQASIELFSYAHALGAQRRAQPADDIVTKLVTPDEDGNELTEMEFGYFFLTLAVAGNETTRNAISGGMLAFTQHPEQWQRLKADLSLAGRAADEIVRWVSPVNAFRRTAMRDIQLGGQQIRAGDKVVMFYASANRDPEVFEDPTTFDIGREPNDQVAFGGGGPHYCLGRHLAKLELEVMLRTLARRIERVELTGPVRRLRSNLVNGIKEMPVRFIPAQGA